MKVAPPGWHLPSDEEWDVLIKYIDPNMIMPNEDNFMGANIAGAKLKATSGWADNGNGTDDYSFSALPGGGSLGNVGYNGSWWSSSSKYNNNMAYALRMGYFSEYAFYINFDKAFLFSIRCVRDYCP